MPVAPLTYALARHKSRETFEGISSALKEEYGMLEEGSPHGISRLPDADVAESVDDQGFNMK